VSANSIVNAVLGVSFVAGITLAYFVLRRLRERHSEHWEALGRPTLVTNNSPANSLATIRFIFRRGYAHWDDPQFIKLADFLRIFWIVYGVFVGLFLLAILTAIVFA
jgi:hypothetical protein